MSRPPEQQSSQEQGGITRRSFTAAAVAAATAALIQPIQAIQPVQPLESTPAIVPDPVPAQDDKSAAAAADAAMAKLSPAARAEVEMKLNSIFRKYGDQLNDEQKTDIRKVMAETQTGLEKMRSFPLENGDLPATVFHAGRGGEKK
ncbi:MAG TPA: hypothetical protein VG649_20655 [Candidatus Angelobacter sp.]|jgi:hypothetical protein|nr:hypothetical protein [Candidatus Angelobacter sp.]